MELTPTPRLIAATIAYEIAFKKVRVAWGGGDKTRARKRLEAANREKVEAEVEAARIASVDAGHFQGAPI